MIYPYPSKPLPIPVATSASVPLNREQLEHLRQVYDLETRRLDIFGGWLLALLLAIYSLIVTSMLTQSQADYAALRSFNAWPATVYSGDYIAISRPITPATNLTDWRYTVSVREDTSEITSEWLYCIDDDQAFCYSF